MDLNNSTCRPCVLSFLIIFQIQVLRISPFESLGVKQASKIYTFTYLQKNHAGLRHEVHLCQKLLEGCLNPDNNKQIQVVYKSWKIVPLTLCHVLWESFSDFGYDIVMDQRITTGGTSKYWSLVCILYAFGQCKPEFSPKSTSDPAKEKGGHVTFPSIHKASDSSVGQKAGVLLSTLFAKGCGQTCYCLVLCVTSYCSLLSPSTPSRGSTPATCPVFLRAEPGTSKHTGR